MQSECDFDAQIGAAEVFCLPYTDGVECEPLFFLRADGKAHVILTGEDGFTKKSPRAMVCDCCGKNREAVLQRFGGGEVAIAGIEGQDIPLERHIPDYGAHGVLRVAHCAVNGMVKVLREHGCLSRTAAARLVQEYMNGARKAARIV